MRQTGYWKYSRKRMHELGHMFFGFVIVLWLFPVAEILSLNHSCFWDGMQKKTRKEKS